jgi:hypothetical protein
MRLKRIQFECDHEELTHLLHKIKGACNSLESYREAKRVKYQNKLN